MNIEREITAHLDWIERIVAILGSPDIPREQIDALSAHDRCELGRWLDTEAPSKYRDLPELQELIDAHTAFHKLAGDMVNALQHGQEDQAIRSEKQFIEASQDVIGHLNRLQAHAQQAS